ncbi:hypothetical protein CLAFUR0_14509 [Fulvia fulva]|nr:hypothetical protein CLAFUR0_14509 [Fulvia fulva]
MELPLLLLSATAATLTNAYPRNVKIMSEGGAFRQANATEEAKVSAAMADQDKQLLEAHIPNISKNCIPSADGTFNKVLTPGCVEVIGFSLETATELDDAYREGDSAADSHMEAAETELLLMIEHVVEGAVDRRLNDRLNNLGTQLASEEGPHDLAALQEDVSRVQEMRIQRLNKDPSTEKASKHVLSDSICDKACRTQMDVAIAEAAVKIADALLEARFAVDDILNIVRNYNGLSDENRQKFDGIVPLIVQLALKVETMMGLASVNPGGDGVKEFDGMVAQMQTDLERAFDSGIWTAFEAPPLQQEQESEEEPKLMPIKTHELDPIPDEAVPVTEEVSPEEEEGENHSEAINKSLSPFHSTWAQVASVLGMLGLSLVVLLCVQRCNAQKRKQQYRALRTADSFELNESMSDGISETEELIAKVTE